MFSLCSNSIFARVASNRYVAYGNESRYAADALFPNLVLLSGKTYRVPAGIYRAAAGGISSDASAAHIDVESSCETHDGLDMGHKTKRYIFMPKTGVVKPKGIFLEVKCK